MRKSVPWLAIAALFLPATAFGELTIPPPIHAQAEGPNGAYVGFTITVVGGNDGSDGRPADTVTCSPASNSLFPLGTTTVTCSGSEGSTGSFTVTVVDTIAPTLTLPRDFTVVATSPAGASVTWVASASDIVDVTVPVACTPASGTSFPLGTTTVTCSATDSHGNTASGQFAVTVATSPPPPGNPDIVAEATGPDGARVTFNTGDADDGDGRPGSGGCAPAPGSLFPLGNTLVTCPSGNFTVSVVDTTPPVLTLPGAINATAGGPPGVVVTFSATASDLVDGNVGVSCAPPSGTTFGLGTTTVHCSATDAHGNTSNGSFPVVVTTEPAPPPSPGDITAEATGPDGAVVTFDPGEDGGRPISCTPSAGSTFPLGPTTVTCSSGATFTVLVVDTTPPDLSVPANMTVEATSSAGAAVSFTATASDLVDGAVAVACTPPSGSTFALGTTTVWCSATDVRGNESADSFDVTVVDTTPPAITAVHVSPASIWPPNNTLVHVDVTVEATDAVDPAPVVRLYLITCDEPIGPNDAIITGPLAASLRADRDAHADGRVYTLYIEAIDASGNRSTATVQVTVPRDQSSNNLAQPPMKRRSIRG